MSTQYSSKIVTNGLVAAYDAKNTKCYVSGSAAPTDLTENFDATILGILQYTGSYGGAFKFSSSSLGQFGGQSRVTNLVTGTGFTITEWVQHNSLRNTDGFQRHVSLGTITPSSDDLIIRHGYNGSTMTNGGIEVIVFTDATPRYLVINNVLTVNVPAQLVVTWNGTTMLVYKNGVQIGTMTPGGAYSPTGHRYFLLSSNGAESMAGQIFSALVYNRPLTPAEILKDYNTTRSRFGV